MPHSPPRQKLPRPEPDWALFLDIDGTLVDFAATPDAAVVDAALLRTLDRLSRAFGGALALISGRQLAAIDRLLAPLVLPAAGLHGVERRGADEKMRRKPVPDVVLHALSLRLQEFAARDPGLLVENKQGGLCLHYRGAPGLADAARDFVANLLAGRTDLILLEGKMLVEIKSVVADKGSAIAEFMAEPPFAGRRPVFLGDDTTDEDGFAAVNAMNGFSICVGLSPRTGADWRIPRPALVRAWLAALPGAIAARRSATQRRA